LNYVRHFTFLLFFIITFYNFAFLNFRKLQKFVLFDSSFKLNEYAKHMGGVDKLNKSICFYRRENRSPKWWKKIFFQLLEYSIHNSKVIYEKLKGKNLSEKEFRMDLIMNFCQKISLHITKPFDVMLNKTNGISIFNGMTFINVKNIHSISSTENRGDCIMCKIKKNQRTRVNYECLLCKKHICIECFAPYHSEFIYVKPE